MWSGGKDAALAYEALAGNPGYRVVALLTTVIEDAETVTMHGVPLSLIRAQAERMQLPLQVMRIPPEASNPTYEAALERALAPLLAEDITTVATGDLFLDDIRAYRAAVLERIGAAPLFPIWQRDTGKLARHVIDAGYRAILTSVDTTQLDAAFVGRRFDANLLDDLPDTVDPCGEHGAFHTFVHDAPFFEAPVSIETGPAHGRGRMRYFRLTSPAANEKAPPSPDDGA